MTVFYTEWQGRGRRCYKCAFTIANQKEWRLTRKFLCKPTRSNFFVIGLQDKIMKSRKKKICAYVNGMNIQKFQILHTSSNKCFCNL